MSDAKPRATTKRCEAVAKTAKRQCMNPAHYWHNGLHICGHHMVQAQQGGAVQDAFAERERREGE